MATRTVPPDRLCGPEQLSPTSVHHHGCHTISSGTARAHLGQSSSQLCTEHPAHDPSTPDTGPPGVPPTLSTQWEVGKASSRALISTVKTQVHCAHHSFTCLA